MVSAEREQPDRPSSFATHSFPPEENGHKYHLICPVPTNHQIEKAFYCQDTDFATFDTNPALVTMCGGQNKPAVGREGIRGFHHDGI